MSSIQIRAVAGMGALYFAFVFTFAFGMGVLRALVVAPSVGETAAVLFEVPMLLVASWFVARWLLRRRPLPPPDCAMMGVIAFSLTMTAEVVLAGLLRGQTATQWGREVATPLGLVGLAGQVAFAALPTFVGQTFRAHSST